MFWWYRMENSENNHSIEDINQLNNLINSQNEEIEQLNYKLNDLRKLLFNQLKDIKEISEGNKSINEEFELLKDEHAKFNESVSEDIEFLKSENVKFNDSVSGDIEFLKSENVRLNDSVSEEFKLLKDENKELKVKFKETDNINQKILDSYKENFKFIFYCYDLKPKPLLNNIQDICQEVLDFVVNVCEKHDVPYWLEAGSLLGAVRHEGFLPWDDDIDLGMMRSDYHRFQEVFDLEIKNHNLENKIKWHLLRHNDNILYFIQISYAGFAILDIFPYDYAVSPLEDMEKLYFSEKEKFKSNIRDGKNYSQAINEVFANLNLSLDKQQYIVSGVERAAKGSFLFHNLDEIFPLSRVTFRGKEYCGLNNNDIHLTKMYGDWRELPKVLERHNRIYTLSKRPDINNFLTEKISLLRNVNKHFKD